MGKLNIGHRLAIIIIGFSVSAILLVGLLFFNQFEEALKERIFLQLSSVRQLKASRIISEIKSDKEKFLAFVQNSTAKPDSLVGFTDMKLYNTWPGKALHIGLSENGPKENFRIFDVTPLESGKDILLAFCSKVPKGYYIAFLKLPEIQQILLERTGLGQTGETYLVDEENRLLTMSRFDLENSRENTINTLAIKKAKASGKGEAVIQDYRQKKVFSAFDLIAIDGLTWVIISEIDYKEALNPLEDLKIDLTYISLIILFLLILGSFLVAKMLVRPVQIMENKLVELSKGKVAGVQTPINRQDEIGRMFEALKKLVNALRETIRYAEEIGTGNFEASYKLMSEDDQMGKSLLMMKDKLKTFKEREELLRKANQQSMLEGEEKERRRLSKEMHDGLGPLLTTLRLHVQSNLPVTETKTQILNTLDEIIHEVRQISNNLMPSVLSDFGSGEAIGNLLERVEKDHLIKVYYKNDMVDPSIIDQQVHTTLYRVTQEGVNNIIKHAKATVIKASLTVFDEHLSFYLADNGAGFDTQGRTHGHGLANMKERVKLIDGDFIIESTSEGTTIEIEIPI